MFLCGCVSIPSAVTHLPTNPARVGRRTCFDALRDPNVNFSDLDALGHQPRRQANPASLNIPMPEPGLQTCTPPPRSADSSRRASHDLASPSLDSSSGSSSLPALCRTSLPATQVTGRTTRRSQQAMPDTPAKRPKRRRTELDLLNL